MKRHFKRILAPDTSIGTGLAYFEFEEDWATRQIEIYGDHWYHSDSPSNYHADLGIGLVDRPLSELELTEEEQISAEEFEGMWSEALRRAASRLPPQLWTEPDRLSDREGTNEAE